MRSRLRANGGINCTCFHVHFGQTSRTSKKHDYLSVVSAVFCIGERIPVFINVCSVLFCGVAAALPTSSFSCTHTKGREVPEQTYTAKWKLLRMEITNVRRRKQDPNSSSAEGALIELFCFVLIRMWCFWPVPLINLQYRHTLH